MSLRQWWDEHKHEPRLIVSVEPAIFFFMLSLFITLPSVQALFIQKVCLREFHSEMVCHNLTNNPEKMDYVQSKVSRWVLLNTCSETFPSMITAVFMGSWGDNVNRKIPIVVPAVGGLLMMVNLVLNSFYMNWHPAFILISNFVYGVLGGFASFLMAVFSYVSVISGGEKERLIRISICEGLMQLSGAVGFALSGLLVKYTGFTYTFVFTMASMGVALLYSVLWIKNPPPVGGRGVGTEEPRSLCARLFDCKHFVAAVKCYFVRREGYKRLILWLSLVAFMIGMITIGGGADVCLLYLNYTIPGWNLVLYGIYNALRMILMTIFLLFILPVIKRFFSIQDTTVGIIGLVSNTAGQLLLAFCKTIWMVMLVPVVNMLAGAGSTALRAIIAKMVSVNEQGKVFAFVGVAQSLSMLIASLIFNNLYPATLHFFPGLTFLVCAFLLMVAVGLTIIIRVYIPKEGIQMSQYASQEKSPLLVNEDTS
ncbi:solute carrier family 46 member 3 [Lingula anatina]|uniref:Solute carrier family 46 member 3 n=1 Tax=Lingula anatina TaxID=7574 RepID=A0A1S3KFG1_LINAN|nr:solute carrier family 46 member 3 [Lingula anatina]|eukprot:XP_013421373.1 solute carrier family 46 member 3 [Lingula anatina]